MIHRDLAARNVLVTDQNVCKVKINVFIIISHISSIYQPYIIHTAITTILIVLILRWLTLGSAAT